MDPKYMIVNKERRYWNTTHKQWMAEGMRSVFSEEDMDAGYSLPEGSEWEEVESRVRAHSGTAGSLTCLV
jgi:hypothetical protein